MTSSSTVPISLILSLILFISFPSSTLSSLPKNYIENDPYSPSFYVEKGAALTPSYEFSPGDLEYAKDAIITAGAPVVAGLLAFALFACGILFRCCCSCVRCRPKHPIVYKAERSEAFPEYSQEEKEFKSYPWNWLRIRNMIFFLLTGCMCVGFVQVLLLGRTNLSDGVDTVIGSVVSLFDVVANVSSNTNTIYDYSYDLQTEFTDAQTTCTALAFSPDTVTTVENSINDFQSVMNTMVTVTDALNLDTSSYQDTIDRYYNDGAWLYILWGCVLLGVFLSFLFAYGEKRNGLRATVCCQSFLFIIFVLLGGIFMLLTIFLSDFCMSPSYNLVRYAPSGDAQNTAAYYSSCSSAYANSSLSDDLNEGRYYVNYMIEQLNDTMSVTCSTDPNLLAMKSTILSINASISEIYSQLDCETSLRVIWRSFVNDGLCGDTGSLYTGIFYIWSSLLFTSFSMFLFILISTMTYQFYLEPKDLPGYAELDDHSDAGDGSVGDEAYSRRSSRRQQPYRPVDPQGTEMVETGQIQVLLGDGNEDLDPRYVNPHPVATATAVPAGPAGYNRVGGDDPAAAKIRANDINNSR